MFPLPGVLNYGQLSKMLPKAADKKRSGKSRDEKAGIQKAR
jgi:hypothetical protein